MSFLILPRIYLNTPSDTNFTPNFLVVLNFPNDIAYPRFDSRMAQRLRHAFLSIIYIDRDNRLGESDNGEKRLEPAAHAITIARVERRVVRQREKKFVQAFSIEEMRKTV